MISPSPKIYPKNKIVPLNLPLSIEMKEILFSFIKSSSFFHYHTIIRLLSLVKTKIERINMLIEIVWFRRELIFVESLLSLF